MLSQLERTSPLRKVGCALSIWVSHSSWLSARVMRGKNGNTQGVMTD